MVFTLLEKAGAMLALQVAGPVSDTLFVRQIETHRSTLEKIADISTILVGLAVVVLLFLLIGAAVEMRTAQQKLLAYIKELRGELAPAIVSVNEVGTNVAAVSGMVKDQVLALGGTAAEANERLRDAMGVASRRLREFDALLEVAQEEAEELLIGAASGIRAVRKGAAALRRGRRRRGRGRSAMEREIERSFAREDGRLWDDELEHGSGPDDEDQIVSAEQGPTIHRRRARTRGPR